MSNPARFGTFYPVWPILDGKPLNLQWGEERSNTAETKAIVRNSYQELEADVDELNAVRALLGLAFGNIDFSNKFRFFYNADTQELCCQRNVGSVRAQSWVDAWCVRFSDGQFEAVGEGGISSDAGFYGPGLQSIEEIGESGDSADFFVLNPTKLFFNADDGFGVQAIVGGANNGQPEVRFTQPFGRAQQFKKTGRVWKVDHNFGISPVLVQTMDNDDRVITPDTVDVSDPNTTWFYFNDVFSGSAYIASGGIGATSLVPRDPFYLIIRTDQQSRTTHLFKPNADLRFDHRFFYVNVDMDAAHGGANKSAFVTLVNPGGGGGGGTPLSVRESDGTPPTFTNVDTVIFDSNSFYLSSNSTGKPTVSFRGTTSSGVTAHGALTGLLNDDHPQYLLVNGTRAMTGDLNMGGKDVLNAASGLFTHQVVAEAFYLKPGSGGEFSKSGNDILIKSKDGDTIVDDDLVVTGDLRVADKVTAEAFYLTTGGELRASSPAITQAFGSTTQWTFQHNLNTSPVLWDIFDTDLASFVPDKVDVSNPNIAYFYFRAPVAGTAIVAGGATGAGISGILFRESDNNPPGVSADTLIFNSENFYLDVNTAGKPQVSLRPRIYDTVGVFNKQQVAAAGALTISGGNVAWNLDNAQVATLNLSSSATLSIPTNIRTGGQYTIIITQTGGNTLSFNNAYKFGDAGAPTLSTAAGKRDVLHFVGYGTEMFCAGVATGF